LELFAASVALVILSADSIVALFPNLVLNYVKAGAVLAIMPMTFFKSLKFASYGSFFGILALANLIIIILCDGFSTNEAPGSILSPSETSIYPTSWLQIPIAFGLIMSGFSGQYYYLALKYSSVFPSLYRDMKNPKDYPRMVNLTYVFTTFTYILIAVSGYLMFGNDVEEEITLSLPHSFINRGTIWLIALNPLTKYPLTIHPLNIELELWMKSKFGSIWSVLISRILISSLVLCVSILVPGFDLIMSILGSTFSFTVSIVFPELCFNKLYTLTKVQKLVSWSLITMGISLAVIGTLWPFII
jgi:amino acid permease